MSSIVICEKGTQAKAIQKAVGTKYGQVLPAQGHILTLKEPDETRPEWAGEWRPELLWPGKFYEKKPVAMTKAKLDAIRNAARSAKRVIIATDCDREGQLIGDEILEHIGFKGEVFRCIFNAEDPKSLQQAFANLKPNKDFHGLYMAGQAREQADQTSNLSLTRTGTAVLKAPGTRGAIGIGRVKTPVLGIVCKRELEIENFRPENLYEVHALTRVMAGDLTLSCSKLPKSLLKEQAAEAGDDDDQEELTEEQAALADQENVSDRIKKKEIAEGLAAAVEGYSGELRSKSEKKKQGPPKLFNLTALSAACSAKFGWSGDKTLEVAQKLYSERTIITYPRGEAKYLPENNIADVPKLVPALLRLSGYGGLGHLLASPIVRKGKSGHFSNKELEGLSHYAIIPNVNSADSFASAVASLTPDEAKLFDVIVRQYLAALAPDFEYRQTTIDMTFPWKSHNWDFRANGRVPLVLGWKEVLGSKAVVDKDDMPDLPQVSAGEKGKVVSASVRSSTTKPPARYNEGSLMTMMEEAWRLVPPGEHRAKLKATKGIGTPATRGSVIKGLFDQGQLVTKGKSVMPSPGGLELYKVLHEVCPNVVDPVRTAVWESIFDMVEKGRMTAQDAVTKILLETRKEIERIKATGGSVRIAIGKAGRPTPKMLELAKKVAERKGVKLPAKAGSDASVCRAFLDANLPPRDPNAPEGQGFPPSDKQLAFAERIAGETGKEIPQDARSSGKALSAWIDANREGGGGAGGSGGGAYPPSDKQLAFARRIAEEAGKEIPAAALSNGRELSAWIDKNKGSGGGTGGGGQRNGAYTGPPSEKQIAFARKLAEENDVGLPADVTKSGTACSEFIGRYMGKSGGGIGKKRA